MNPLILLPIVVCVLTSCTLSDVQSKASGGTRPADSMTVSRNAELQDTPRVTDPTLVATILRDAYSEERLAEDIYTKMVARYPQFTEVMNIINSEEKHSLQVGRLLDARGITRPTDYGSYSGTYDTLSKMVDSSLSGAIEA